MWPTLLAGEAGALLCQSMPATTPCTQMLPALNGGVPLPCMPIGARWDRQQQQLQLCSAEATEPAASPGLQIRVRALLGACGLCCIRVARLRCGAAWSAACLMHAPPSCTPPRLETQQHRTGPCSLLGLRHSTTAIPTSCPADATPCRVASCLTCRPELAAGSCATRGAAEEAGRGRRAHAARGDAVWAAANVQVRGEASLAL